MHDLIKLGENLKRIRSIRNLSLSKVSELTDVSKTMLSQIENGKSTPTLSVIWKISNGLKVPLASLIGNVSNEYEVIKIEDIKYLEEDDGRLLLYCIFPFTPVSGFEYFQGIIKPGCNYFSKYHRNVSEEYLVVTKGVLDLIIGKTTYHLEAGSAISFDGTEDHTYCNFGEEDAEVQIVIKYN